MRVPGLFTRVEALTLERKLKRQGYITQVQPSRYGSFPHWKVYKYLKRADRRLPIPPRSTLIDYWTNWIREELG